LTISVINYTHFTRDSYKSRRENIPNATILSSQNSYPKLTLIISLNDRTFQCNPSRHAQNAFKKLLKPAAAAVTKGSAYWILSPAYAATVAFRVNGFDIFPLSGKMSSAYSVGVQFGQPIIDILRLLVKTSGTIYDRVSETVASFHYRYSCSLSVMFIQIIH